LKEAKTGLRLAKKEREKGDWFAYQAVIRELEYRFARHIALEGEARQLESDLRTIESKREE
jgi:hypothetical protein